MLAKMKKNDPKEKANFTCSNPRCNKEFTHPLTVDNLSAANPTTYVGCPYCLTPIQTTDNPADDERKPKRQVTETKIEEGKATRIDADAEPKEPASPQKCPKHFGYLSERSKGEETPEECLSCPNLIDCMRAQ